MVTQESDVCVRALVRLDLACVDRLFGNFEELKSFLTTTYGRDARQHALW